MCKPKFKDVLANKLNSKIEKIQNIWNFDLDVGTRQLGKRFKAFRDRFGDEKHYLEEEAIAYGQLQELTNLMDELGL